MSSVGVWKFLCVCAVFATLCPAQQKISTPTQNRDARPAIFQRQIQTPEIVSAPGTPEAQLSAANFHVASDEEIEGMEQTLEHYVIAFESLDLAGIQQVWPDMDKQHAKTFKNVFSAFRSSSSKPRVSLQCSIPNVADATADVHCSETVTYDAGKGKTKQAGPAKISLELKSQSGRWIVEEIKGI